MPWPRFQVPAAATLAYSILKHEVTPSILLSVCCDCAKVAVDLLRLELQMHAELSGKAVGPPRGITEGSASVQPLVHL